MYILFPIGIMYYFGTNLDQRFAVPDFWPKPEQTHKIPYERDEISAELERLKLKRLAARNRRLQAEGKIPEGSEPQIDNHVMTQDNNTGANSKGWTSWFGR